MVQAQAPPLGEMRIWPWVDLGVLQREQELPRLVSFLLPVFHLLPPSPAVLAQLRVRMWVRVLVCLPSLRLHLGPWAMGGVKPVQREQWYQQLPMLLLPPLLAYQ